MWGSCVYRLFTLQSKTQVEEVATATDGSTAHQEEEGTENEPTCAQLSAVQPPLC